MTKFIELTRKIDRMKLMVNVDTITFFTSLGNGEIGTCVGIRSASDLFRETYEEIIQKINPS